jgi:hypothetical protein
MDTQRRERALEQLLNAEAPDDCVGVPISMICDWRVQVEGSRGRRLSKRLMFNIVDLREWMETVGRPAQTPQPSHALGVERGIARG